MKWVFGMDIRAALLIGLVGGVLVTCMVSNEEPRDPCLDRDGPAMRDIKVLQDLSDRRLAECDRLGLQPTVDFYTRLCNDSLPVVTGCGAPNKKK